MAEVKLHLNDLNAPELIATGKRLVAGLEGNAHFAQPKPTVEELKQKISELDAAQEEYRKHRLELNALKTERDALMDSLKMALGAAAEYVQETSDGDSQKIISAGLCAERTWHFWPFGSLPQVTDLAASIGEQPGEIDLVWDRVRGAQGYEISYAIDVTGEGPWEQCGATADSRITLKDLNPHIRYWFRVRAIGDKQGDWSDPVTKYTR
ncbi:MAG TPA: fibronectin type III domain-containing protein [Chthoniobacteraceae bacterium]|nr:fibronectin type III domain-containing protein [Chthoniobacteraceae bacterium]